MINKKFVIAVYSPSSLTNTAGGAFTYIEVLMDFLTGVDDNELCFKIIRETESKEKEVNNIRNQILLDYNEIRYSIKQKIVFKVSSLIPFLKRKRLKQRIIQGKKEMYIISTLKKNDVDLIYYPNQHSALTMQYPFVINNWDLAHITVPPLPDTLNGIKTRERWYAQMAVRAISIFSESETGKTEIQELLNIPAERIKVLPIFPGKVVHLELSLQRQLEVLKKFKLQANEYFFYPAQFWALKNHYHLVEAVSLIDFKNKKDFKIVFSGSDKNNMAYIKNMVANLNLDDRVLFLGFISNDELYTLYKNSLALVFPSLL